MLVVLAVGPIVVSGTTPLSLLPHDVSTLVPQMRVAASTHRINLFMLCFFFYLGDEAGHEAVGDGGTDPDLGEHIVGVLVGGLQIDVEGVKGGNEHIDDADEPEVALGVTLPVLARIEEGERAEQQHRQRETGQMDGVIGEGRRKEDVAQQHRYTHGDGTPVIELLGGDAT